MAPAVAPAMSPKWGLPAACQAAGRAQRPRVREVLASGQGDALPISATAPSIGVTWSRHLNRNDPYLAQASAMPAMPEVATKLLKSFERDDLSMGELGALILRDQALSAKVLRLANSAHYSPSRDVSSVADAAACLGLCTLRDLSLSAAMAGAFPVLPGMDRLAFWRANLATGCYAQVLARALDADTEVAYMGGLMLRTGQVLMSMVSPELMAEVAEHAHEVDSRIGFEQAILGRSHPEVTADLARHWKFPDKLVAAFGAAVDPLESRPFCRLGATLRLASVVTEARDAGWDACEVLGQRHAPLLAHLQLDLEWLAGHLPDHALASAGADTMVN